MPIADRSRVKSSSNPWMTSVELGDFRKMRRDGVVTFFRSAKCATCSEEIHQSKRFCSKDCYEKSGENGVSKT